MFTTKRLLIRGVDWDRDGKHLTQIGNNRELLDLLSPEPRVPSSHASVQERYGKAGTLPSFAVCLKTESPETAWPNNLTADDDYYALAPAAIGFVGFHNRDFDFKNRTTTIGINFSNPAHRGKGYGQEVLEWLLGYAFEELGLHKVMLQVYENNDRARKCYERCGFVTEGRMRKMYYGGGRWWDIFTMGVLEEEWFERKRKEGEKVSITTVTKG